MKLYLYYFLNTFFTCCLGSLLLFSACQNKQSQQEQDSTTTSVNLPAPTQVQVAYTVPDGFSAQINKVINAYLATKDALVASDVQQTNQKVGDLIVAIEQTDTTALNVMAAKQWIEHQKILQRAATTLQAATQIDDKRASFEDLSQAVYALVKDFGAHATLYKEYCPMALHDKGAYWLSAQSEVRNPYFGDKMLECGEVQEVLKFKE